MRESVRGMGRNFQYGVAGGGLTQGHRGTEAQRHRGTETEGVGEGDFAGVEGIDAEAQRRRGIGMRRRRRRRRNARAAGMETGGVKA
jgi:hypothetical protein